MNHSVQASGALRPEERAMDPIQYIYRSGAQYVTLGRYALCGWKVLDGICVKAPDTNEIVCIDLNGNVTEVVE